MKDLRPNVIYPLRNQILDPNGILAQVKLVKSEKNDLAGPLSRGLFRQFLEKAKEKEFSQFRWADVRRLVISINLDDLFEHLPTLTN